MEMVEQVERLRKVYGMYDAVDDTYSRFAKGKYLFCLG
jgi:hypothetical protein